VKVDANANIFANIKAIVLALFQQDPLYCLSVIDLLKQNDQSRE